MVGMASEAPDGFLIPYARHDLFLVCFFFFEPISGALFCIRRWQQGRF